MLNTEPFQHVLLRDGRAARIVARTLRSAAKAVDIPWRCLLHRVRYPDIAQPRQFAWWLAWQMGATTSAIARVCGWDQSTVNYAVHKVDREIEAGDGPWLLWLELAQ